MSSVELRIRRLQTGEVLVAAFEDPPAAEKWLRERPAFVEVQRLLTEVEPTLEQTLRAAMRPLDEEEMAAIRKLEIEQLQRMQAKRAEAQAALDAEQPPDDPDRPMVVRWARERGMWLPDDDDDREIPPHVREAVLAWIDERNDWVRSRDQHVATAIVSVDPRPIVDGDPIAPGGQFVTAPGAAPVDDA